MTLHLISYIIGSTISRIIANQCKPSKTKTDKLPAVITESRKDKKIKAKELELMELRLKADMAVAARTFELKERELAIKQELGLLYLDAVRQRTSKEVALREQELQAQYDQGKWTSMFSREEIRQLFSDAQQKHRLLVLVPEPYIANDLPSTFRDNLKTALRSKLKRFVEKHYPLESDICPVEFYGGFFERSVFDAEIKKLEAILPIPTAVIYTDINNREVYFHLKLTGLDKTLSLTCDEWNWRDAKRELEKSGCDATESLEQIEDSIVKVHQLFAAFLADWYYLNINPYYVPRLFDFQAQFARDLPQDWVTTWVTELQKTQQALQTAYEESLEKTTSDKGQPFEFDVITVNAYGQEIKQVRGKAFQYIEDLGGRASLEMVYIPQGTFMMGSPEGEGSSSEKPQHQVTISPFYMSKYLVTQAQYEAVMNTNPSKFKGAKRPVEVVSWDDAMNFCRQLSKNAKKLYSLPSEAQWEYACRAGTTTPFHFGETITPDLVNYRGDYPYASAPKGENRKQTTDVGSFPPNAFGLYDMHGNVWEWCLDDWEDNYKTPRTQEAYRKNGSEYKSLRGGSWYFNAYNCRASYRFNNSPSNRNYYFGFRVVIVLR